MKKEDLDFDDWYDEFGRKEIYFKKHVANSYMDYKPKARKHNPYQVIVHIQGSYPRVIASYKSRELALKKLKDIYNTFRNRFGEEED